MKEKTNALWKIISVIFALAAVASGVAAGISFSDNSLLTDLVQQYFPLETYVKLFTQAEGDSLIFAMQIGIFIFAGLLLLAAILGFARARILGIILGALLVFAGIFGCLYAFNIPALVVTVFFALYLLGAVMQ